METKASKIRTFQYDDEPVLIHIIKSGYVEEPNLMVLYESGFDELEYEGVFSKKEIEEKYKIIL